MSSYQLRPLQPQQQPEAQQQQQQDSEHGTYDSNNGYSPSQQQQQQQQQMYTQYPGQYPAQYAPGQYQWPAPAAAGYGSEAAAAAAAAGQTYYWSQYQPPGLTIPVPHPAAKSPFGDEYAGSTAGTDALSSSGYPHSLAARTAASQKQTPQIWGIKRNYFYILLAVGSFLLVLGIATGVGVGLALSDRHTPSETSATPTATSTQSAATPSFTGTLVSAPVTCPQNNNTVYLSAGDKPKPFNIECGRDYSSDDGAKDLSVHKDVGTMAECVDLCGQRAGCVGVGYGDYESTWTCWLKSQLGQPNNSPQWYAARLQHVD